MITGILSFYYFCRKLYTVSIVDRDASDHGNLFKKKDFWIIFNRLEYKLASISLSIVVEIRFYQVTTMMINSPGVDSQKYSHRYPCTGSRSIWIGLKLEVEKVGLSVVGLQADQLVLSQPYQ